MKQNQRNIITYVLDEERYNMPEAESDMWVEVNNAIGKLDPYEWKPEQLTHEQQAYLSKLLAKYQIEMAKVIAEVEFNHKTNRSSTGSVAARTRQVRTKQLATISE